MVGAGSLVEGAHHSLEVLLLVVQLLLALRRPVVRHPPAGKGSVGPHRAGGLLGDGMTPPCAVICAFTSDTVNVGTAKPSHLNGTSMAAGAIEMGQIDREEMIAKVTLKGTY